MTVLSTVASDFGPRWTCSTERASRRRTESRTVKSPTSMRRSCLDRMRGRVARSAVASLGKRTQHNQNQRRHSGNRQGHLPRRKNRWKSCHFHASSERVPRRRIRFGCQRLTCKPWHTRILRSGKFLGNALSDLRIRCVAVHLHKAGNALGLLASPHPTHCMRNRNRLIGIQVRGQRNNLWNGLVII